MAKLFLSYSRKDAHRAQRFTEWLEGKGHDVWRDEDDIGGGASFSSEIEKALNECGAVLALWSADSVQSGWVRDEAGFGRDHGKLIPFSLDGTEPPLGFRQFQSIDLSRWKGKGEPPGADRIRSAIDRICGSAAPAAMPIARPARLSRKTLMSALLAPIAVGILAFVLWQTRSSSQEIEITVLPSPQSPDRAMATDYANVAAADLAAFLPRRFDRATLIAPADATGQTSGYRMEISVDPRGAAANASLTLSDQDGHTTLWSKSWSASDAAAADLKAEVSAFASKAALCLTDARGGSTRLTQPALGLYLNGCTGIGETKLSEADFLTIFERVTKLAPDFAPAWDYLALTRSWIAEGLDESAPSYAAALKSARETIAIARKLNPTSAISYDAEFHLISNDTFGGLKVLEEGAKIDPDDGRIQMHLSDALLAVGRLSDAVRAAQRAVQLEPGSPYSRSQYIQVLVYTGQFSNARADIADARRKWPKDPAIDYAELAYQFRYGDARAALPLLPRLNGSSDAALAPYRKIIAARIDPTPAKIDDAITALKTGGESDPRVQSRLLQALGNFGRVDQVYQLLNDPHFEPSVDRAILFRPDFAAVRAEPRFIQVAARLGLVRYWWETGYWPDFCKSEQIRYDCRTEAARYRN